MIMSFLGKFIDKHRHGDAFESIVEEVDSRERKRGVRKSVDISSEEHHINRCRIMSIDAVVTLLLNTF